MTAKEKETLKKDIIREMTTPRTRTIMSNYLTQCAFIAEFSDSEREMRRETTKLVNSMDLDGFYAITSYMVASCHADMVTLTKEREKEELNHGIQ